MPRIETWDRVQRTLWEATVSPWPVPPLPEFDEEPGTAPIPEATPTEPLADDPEPDSVRDARPAWPKRQ